MSDSVTPMDPQEDPKPKHPGLWKKIALFLLILALVSSVVALSVLSDGFNIDTLRRWVKYMTVDMEASDVYSFDSHSSNQYGTLDGGLVVASVSGLNTFAEDGTEKFSLQQQMNLPRLLCRGNLAVAYDVAGHDLLAVHSRNGEVLRLQEKRPILDVDLSEGGYLALSTSTSGYKSVLAVYNSQQDLIYRWLSSTTYIPLCAISSDGNYLAAIGLGQKNGSFVSTLYFYRTDSEQVQQSVSLGSELIYDIVFLDKGNLCAIGESTIQFFDLQGEPLGVYSYENNYLKDFDDGGDGFLALALNMYKAGNRYSLYTVDEKGEELASVYLGQEILDLSACGKYVAVLTPEGLTIYTSNLSVYHKTVDTGNATAVVMQKDGSVLLLSNGQGRLYIP